MELNIIAICEFKLRYAWETYILLNNLRERRLSHITKIFTFTPYSLLKEQPEEMWLKLEEDFPEVEFFHYKDLDDKELNYENKLLNLFNYRPLLRPHILAEYWRLHPEMKDKAVFYIDTDIILTKDVDFSKFLNDDVIYVSNAPSYTSAEYFDSKSRLLENGPEFVHPQMYEEFKKRDILNECAWYAQTTREAIGKTQGAAQYLLKNVDAEFWDDVKNSCITIKNHLAGINLNFMRGNSPQERENNGFQSWCADIWAVLWQIVKRGRIIENPGEFDFSWATEDVKNWESKSIYHNAGISGHHKLKVAFEKRHVDCNVFFKDKDEYKLNLISPFEDIIYLNNILKDPISKTLCVYKYVEEIIKTKNNFKL